MWGTQYPRRRIVLDDRFIPTHVGNTTSPTIWRLIGAVHPHACGEHFNRLTYVSVYNGSSPRMWGTPPLGSAVMVMRRFIPTHVGNTPPAIHPGLTHSVHPHACGEHNRCGVSGSWFDGSSPRMWGTLTPELVGIDPGRFIPTHVGNTQTRRCSSMPSAVHPHACGEHRQGRVEQGSPRGSSPRMWGTLLLR